METMEDLLLGIALFAGAIFSWWIFVYQRQKKRKASLQKGKNPESK